MINYKQWINPKCGLELEANLSPDKRHNENGILFLSHLLMLKSELNELDDDLINEFRSITRKLRAYNKQSRQVQGCYDRGTLESKLGHESGGSIFVRNISHDNITGILTGSLITNSKFHQHIQKFGVRNGGLYDNVSIDKPRFLHKNHKDQWTTTAQWHPRDIFFWQYFGGNRLGVFWMWPIYFIIQMLDMLSPYRNSSAKLLGILRLESTKKSPSIKVLRWICYKILKRQYGADFMPKLYKIYFWQEDHPLPKLADQLYKYRK